MVVIRLSRRGAKHSPKYRVTVADSRRSAKCRFIEIIGHYDPLSKEKTAVINSEKYIHWISKGAKPSRTVASLYKKTQNPAGREKPSETVQKSKPATKSTEREQMNNSPQPEKPTDSPDKNTAPREEAEK